MERIKGKGIVVPEALLRGGVGFHLGERGDVCVTVDHELSEELAPVVASFIGRPLISDCDDSLGVVWYQSLSGASPGLGAALSSELPLPDDDLAALREHTRARSGAGCHEVVGREVAAVSDPELRALRSIHGAFRRLCNAFDTMLMDVDDAIAVLERADADGAQRGAR